MEINEHILKLKGKVNIPEALEIGHNYQIGIQGSITGDANKDNNDGTFDRYYDFEPVMVEVVDPKGKRIQAKDKRKQSQKLRARFYMLWQESKEQLDFDRYYEQKMASLITKLDEFIDFL